MRYLIVIFAFVFFSCNQKQEYEKVSNRVSVDKNDIHKSEAKKFLISNVYDENDSDFSDVQVNYNIGKFVFDKNYNEFIIDSTFDQDIAYQKLKDYLLDQYADDKNIIRLSNYVFSLQKDEGFLYIGLFRIIDRNKWKCKDLIKLEKYSELGEYNYILGNGKIFSYACNTSAGDSCFAVVIDKVNSAGKYDKILKAVKFDLVNEKIIEIDLNKEKIECLPENE
jgi:archaellum component FlaF (FlaF/FlaG flagellin family)